MRLTPDEIAAIRTAATEVFGPDVVVRLFGSRLRDDVRGGDIDLHLEIPGGRPDARTAGIFRMNLWDAIGERAIDLVFHDPQAPLRPIDRVALAEGAVL